MPRVKKKAQKFHCLFPGCLSTFDNDRDRTKHNGVHYIQHCHKNAYVCEVCCVQYHRADNLNSHRMETHGLVKMDKTFVVVEYCGSFK